MAAVGGELKLVGLLNDDEVDQVAAFLNTLTFAAHEPWARICNGRSGCG